MNDLLESGKTLFRRLTKKEIVPPDTYLDDLAKEQQGAWDKFLALPNDDPSKLVAWWEYRFIQNRRTNAIVDEWHSLGGKR